MPQPNRSIDAATARRLLGVSPSVGPEALRQAFNRAVKAAHPDLPGGDGERLRAVIEAYRWLDAAAPRPAEPPSPPAAEERATRLEISVTQAVSGGWARLRAGEADELTVRLPAGLRAGELVRISGETFNIAITGAPQAAVAGDDVLITVHVARETMLGGGRVLIDTPTGETSVWMSRADATRGFVRMPSLGLPPRGARGAGDLIVRFKAAADPRFDTPVQSMRRRFAAAWAA